MTDYVRRLTAGPLPAGAEIHDYYRHPGGYIDATFPDGEQPVPLLPGEVADLIAAGAVDCRAPADVRATWTGYGRG